MLYYEYLLNLDRAEKYIMSKKEFVRFQFHWYRMLLSLGWIPWEHWQ